MLHAASRHALIPLLALILIPPTCCLFGREASGACPPPSSEKMDELFHLWLKKETDSAKIRVAIFPFEDGSQVEQDEVLEWAFPWLFHELLAGGKESSLFHPFLIQKEIEKQGLVSKDFFDEAKMTPVAFSLGATHAVFGLFQKQTDRIVRYFIKIVPLDQKKSPSPILEFTAVEGDRFFSVTEDAAARIAAHAGLKKIDPSILKKQFDPNPIYEAFRFLVKGFRSSGSYRETELTVSRVWFEKATSTSYTFLRAFDELARASFMLGLIARQSSKNASLFYTEGEEFLSKAGGVKSGADSKRWWQGHQSFVLGAGLLKTNSLREAERNLAESVRLVPEDGVAHFFLSQVYQQTGNPKAAEEKALASSIGSCVE